MTRKARRRNEWKFDVFQGVHSTRTNDYSNYSEGPRESLPLDDSQNVSLSDARRSRIEFIPETGSNRLSPLRMFDAPTQFRWEVYPTARVFNPPGGRKVPRNRDVSLRHLPIYTPSRVMFCLRRKWRKEVLFAFGVAGKRGVGRGKSWHRSINSQYGC